MTTETPPVPFDHAEMTARTWLSMMRHEVARAPLSKETVQRAEHHLDELFFDLLRGSIPDLFLEVGAHDGQRAVRAKAEMPICRSIALEANPRIYERYSTAFDFAASGVTYRNLAAAGVIGEVEFHAQREQEGAPTGDSSLLPRKPNSTVAARESECMTIQAVTLDSLSTTAKRVVAWVDVEGATGLVLDGSSKTLPKVKVLKVEVEEEEFWMGQQLAAKVLARLMLAGLTPIARDLGSPVQFNLLLVSDDVLGRKGVPRLIDNYLRTWQGLDLRRGEAPGLLGAVRRNPHMRTAARSIRQALSRP